MSDHAIIPSVSGCNAAASYSSSIQSTMMSNMQSMGNVTVQPSSSTWRGHNFSTQTGGTFNSNTSACQPPPLSSSFNVQEPYALQAMVDHTTLVQSLRPRITTKLPHFQPSDNILLTPRAISYVGSGNIQISATGVGAGESPEMCG